MEREATTEETMSLDTATVATTVTMNSPIGELELAARAGSIC